MKVDCLVRRNGRNRKFHILNLKFGDATVAQRLIVRTVNHMSETSPEEREWKPVRKTRVINFSIVVDYDTNKWEDDPFGIEVELCSRLFTANEVCEEVQVLHAYTAKVFDSQN